MNLPYCLTEKIDKNHHGVTILVKKRRMWMEKKIIDEKGSKS